jgi:hypothetical protein
MKDFCLNGRGPFIFSPNGRQPFFVNTTQPYFFPNGRDPQYSWDWGTTSILFQTDATSIFL